MGEREKGNGADVKLINTTAFPNHFLRRMVSWCCRQLGHKISKVREAAFRHGAGGGLAWSERGTFGVRCVKFLSTDHAPNKDAPPPFNTYAVNDVVHVTAHEVFHL